MTCVERYLFTLQAAKAAFKLYASAPSDQTFTMACQAVNDHQEARQTFLEHYGKHPPITTPPCQGGDTPTDT